MAVRNDNAEKMVDSSSGIQTIRGGQRVGEGFISSTIAAYANLVYHPIALTLFIFAIFVFIGEVNNSAGPFEILQAACIRIIADPNYPAPVKQISAIILTIDNFLIAYKSMIAATSLVWFTYATKPSSRNACISAVLSAVVIFTQSFTVLDIFVLSQLFFLFANLRTPAHKYFMLFLFCIIFVTSLLDLNKLAQNNNTSFANIASVELKTLFTKDTAAREVNMRKARLEPFSNFNRASPPPAEPIVDADL